MSGFYRGSTPTFKITPVGYSVDELGDPTVTLSQELVFKDLDVEVDSENNCLIAKLSYLDSLNFVAGVKARLQCVWTTGLGTENQKIVPFDAHEVTVLENYVEFVVDEEGNVVE